MTQNNTNAYLTVHQSKLEWKYFLEMMMFLQTVKRENFPDEVLRWWFRIFTDKGWSKNKFDEQFQKVVQNKTFGSVKIDDFFSDEILYTSEQVGNLVENRINIEIQKAKKLLEGREIEIDLPVEVDEKIIKYEIAKRIITYYRDEKETLIDEIIDELFPMVLERLELKRKDNGRIGGGTKLRKKFGW